MSKIGIGICIVAVMMAGVACAAECPGNPDALGTSRTIYLDPTEHPRVGTMQYRETLPLEDHEIVLTFDDGPLPPRTSRVLDALASQCVKATFFSVGKMATEFPATLRRVYAEGHSIGTHTENHPYDIRHAPLAVVQAEVEGGIESVTNALGDPKAVAPFFRIPGLERQDEIDDYLNARGLMIFSADFVADDWRGIRASDVLKLALKRIEAKGRGILLLHDIQPATVAALPQLLKELKRRGYHIVHVAPSKPDQPKTITEPAQWLMSGKKPTETPEVVGVETSRELKTTAQVTTQQQLAANWQTIGAPHQLAPETPQSGHPEVIILRRGIPLPPERPRALGQRSHERLQHAGTIAPPLSRYDGPVEALPVTADRPELATGSIGATRRGDEVVLRPTADIPSASTATSPKIQAQ